jgi:protein-S-isoprenylcysteine O-methyltransferase Ste14
MSWLIYWMIAARRTAATRQEESKASRTSYTVLLAIGVIFLFSRQPDIVPLRFVLLRQSLVITSIGLCLVVLGLSISIWARRHLGKYWSGQITLKENHKIIKSGPYGFVRHPIYSGLVLALLGTMVTTGTFRSLLGFALIVLSLVGKLMLEERWLCAHLGMEYEQYRRQVKALIPFLL